MIPSLAEGRTGPTQRPTTTWAQRGGRGDSHLVVWMKLTAVDVVVVTPECGDQLAGVEAVHSH